MDGFFTKAGGSAWSEIYPPRDPTRPMVVLLDKATIVPPVFGQKQQLMVRVLGDPPHYHSLLAWRGTSGTLEHPFINS